MVMMALLGVLFLMSIQPMMMVIMLVMITMSYSLFVYKIMGSYWFSYALMLVMLSGVLVVFMYMISLMPNESFEIMNLIFIIFFMIYFTKVGYFMYGFDISFVSLNLWNSYIGMFNLFLVGFLLLMMVMVVWISCVGEGAVRIN